MSRWDGHVCLVHHGPDCPFLLLPEAERRRIERDVAHDLILGRARAKIVDEALARSAPPDKKRRPF